MSAPIKLVATFSAAIVVILSMTLLFLSASYEDQRSTALREAVITNLKRKSNRNLPSDQVPISQQDLAHFNVEKPGVVTKDYKTNVQPNAFEEAVWERLYNKFGNKISPDASLKTPMPTAIGPYQTTSRKISWSKSGQKDTTVVYTYLYGQGLNDIKAVKVQAIIDGKDYSTNVAVVHDSNYNNFGNFSGVPVLDTPTNIIDSQDRKSGESVSKSYTTDTGNNIVWDANFVQPLKYGMDHIVLTYQFDQNLQKVAIPDNLSQIFKTASDTDVPVKILQASAGNQPFTVQRDQVKIDNNAGTIKVTLTKDQSLAFFNLDNNNNEQLLFRVYTMLGNRPITHDYAAATATLETVNDQGQVINTQTTDTSKIRVTPFAIQPIDVGSSGQQAIQTLTGFINKMYGSDTTSKTNNNNLADAQQSFAKASNQLVK